MYVVSFATLPRKSTPKNVEQQQAKCVLATALYDNAAEAPEELAFCKGDILTVLEQNHNGLVGWWLCSLRGKFGICPGNRLRLMGHVVCSASPLSTSPIQSRHVRQASDPLRGFPSALSQTSPHQQNANLTSRERKFTNPNKVIIPHKVGDVYLYDAPEPRIKTPSPTPKRLDVSYDVPPSSLHNAAMYDIPRSHHQSPGPVGRQQTPLLAAKGTYDTPKSAEESYDIPRPLLSAQRHSTGELPGTLDYDIPKTQHECTQMGNQCYDVPTSVVAALPEMTYDVPPSTTVKGSGMGHSNRSSCASISSSSSGPSPVLSGASLTSSLSLSSLGGNSSSNRSSLGHSHDVYDIPRPLAPESDAMDSLVLDSEVPLQQTVTNTTAVITTTATTTTTTENVYDVPPQVTRDFSSSGPLRTHHPEAASSPKRHSDPITSTTISVEGRELPLELDAAMDMLVKLQQNVQSSTGKLFNLVNAPALKRKAVLDSRSYELLEACMMVKDSSQEFLNFANGALVNSSKGADLAVCQRLSKLLCPLHDANKIVKNTCMTLESNTWTAGGNVPDELDRLVACARTLIEDVRQIACFIQGNSTLIFKRASAQSAVSRRSEAGSGTASPTGPASLLSQSALAPVALPPKARDRPLPSPPVRGSTNNELKKPEPSATKHDENLYENDGHDWIDDYDYVSLESKESFQKETEEIKASLPEALRKSFDNVLKESLVQVDDSLKGKLIRGGLSVANPSSKKIHLDVNDRQVVKYYLEQLETHNVYLNNAIQAFLQTVEGNQPPKIFVDHGKFVILGAHKLVFIGDTIHRNVSHPELRHRVQRFADGLCDALKTTVQRIKTAAQQFPSVLAVQEMVDSVVDVSHAACELRATVAQFETP